MLSLWIALLFSWSSMLLDSFKRLGKPCLEASISPLYAEVLTVAA